MHLECDGLIQNIYSTYKSNFLKMQFPINHKVTIDVLTSSPASHVRNRAALCCRYCYEFDLPTDVTDELYIVHSVLLTHDSMTCSPVPPGRLSNSQRGGPRRLVADLHGPLQILFSSHISEGVIFTGEQTWVCCHSCPWHRTSAHSHLKAGF